MITDFCLADRQAAVMAIGKMFDKAGVRWRWKQDERGLVIGVEMEDYDTALRLYQSWQEDDSSWRE